MTKSGRATKYIWRMAAEPPICGSGRTVQRIRQCPLPRRGQVCQCFFEVNEIVDDLEQAGAADLAEWFEDEIDADDIGQLITDFHRARARVDASNAETKEQVGQGLEVWIARFNELQEAGAGLTGRYSDDLDF